MCEVAYHTVVRGEVAIDPRAKLPTHNTVDTAASWRVPPRGRYSTKARKFGRKARWALNVSISRR